MDQTYSYVACGARETTDHYLITPTANVESTSSTLSSTSSVPEIPTSSSSVHSSSSSASLAASSVSQPSQTATPASDSTTNISSTPNNTGVIIGGSIAGLAVVCACIVAVVYLLKRSRSSRKSIKDYQPQPEQKPIERGSTIKPNTYVARRDELGAKGGSIAELPHSGSRQRPFELPAEEVGFRGHIMCEEALDKRSQE